MEWKLLFRKRALKQARKLAAGDRKRLLTAFKRLEQNPQTKNLDIKKLQGTKSSYRIRVGDVRAIFMLDDKNRVIYVWEVGYRGDIY